MEADIAIHANAPAIETDSLVSLPASRVALWIFLAGEIMIFGGLVACFMLYRIAAGGWTDEASHVDWQVGTINTVVLLTSSLTMILALAAVRRNDQQAVKRFLAVTVALGIAFLGVKAFEYHGHIVEGFTPSKGMFWSFYYTMTGLHALHVTGGIVVNSILLIMAIKGTLWARGETRLEIAGLYWHFVDVVWILLFPLLYLSLEAK
ncbi:MAG TPA: heme-copper oxidase subunit III [Candidatus Binataceae bacterium]|nr:heme-copper oxidase subunit III [Candidatus Binataceae bacterium]